MRIPGSRGPDGGPDPPPGVRGAPHGAGKKRHLPERQRPRPDRALHDHRERGGRVPEVPAREGRRGELPELADDGPHRAVAGANPRALGVSPEILGVETRDFLDGGGAASEGRWSQADHRPQEDPVKKTVAALAALAVLAVGLAPAA